MVAPKTHFRVGAVYACGNALFRLASAQLEREAQLELVPTVAQQALARLYQGRGTAADVLVVAEVCDRASKDVRVALLELGDLVALATGAEGAAPEQGQRTARTSAAASRGTSEQGGRR